MSSELPLPFYYKPLPSSLPLPLPTSNSIFSYFLSPLRTPFCLLLIIHLPYSFFITFISTRPSLSLSDVNLLVPSFLTSSLTTLLSILLSFHIAEASSRRILSLRTLHTLSHNLRSISRKLQFLYPSEAWHPGDHHRILAHLTSVPLALFQSLVSSPHRAPFAQLLHPNDISKLFESPLPHKRCTTVVRSYLAAIEDDSPTNFAHVPVETTPAGHGTRYHIIRLVDSADASMDRILRMAKFRPAQPYRNHLRILIVLWSFFIPLTIVEDTEWFTPLWSFLAVYGVSAVFAVSTRLDRPLLSRKANIELERMFVGFANNILKDAEVAPSFQKVLRPDHETPSWLRGPLPSRENITGEKKRFSLYFKAVVRTFTRPSAQVISALGVFVLWSAFVVFLTWGLSQKLGDSRLPGERWWTIRVPLTNTALGYFSMPMFLMLSFWNTNSFRRLFEALILWSVNVKTNIDAMAHIITIVLAEGTWHQRDRERLFSYLVAMPVAMKLYLRGDRSVTELQELLDLHDCNEFTRDPRPFPVHCMDVILAYLDSVDLGDRKLLHVSKRPYSLMAFTLQTVSWNVDRYLWQSHAINCAPVSKLLTSHLKLFVTIWLALLPMVVVQTDGFVSFVFLIPIAYSVLNLVDVADSLGTPFSSHRHLVPMDTFCDEFKDSVHRIYLDNIKGTRGTTPTHKQYNREEIQVFYDEAEIRNLSEPDLQSEPEHRSLVSSAMHMFSKVSLSPFLVEEKPLLSERDVDISVRGSFLSLIKRFPTISFSAYIASTLWTTSIVLLSWWLSALWENQDRGACQKWCSPIDVDGSILSNVGFAFFLIVSLRAADGLQRFEDGAALLYQLGRHIRQIAIEVAHAFPSDFYHPGDKERVLAHVVQIPLCLCELLRCNDGRASSGKGILSKEDQKRFVGSADPMQYLVESVATYVLLQDSTLRQGWEISDFHLELAISSPLVTHLAELRNVIAKACSIRRFSTIASYRKLERIFATVWLGLLPLSLTAELGFYTILWAPLISYIVLTLQDMASQLADPFGYDPGDLPVEALCTQASNLAIDAVLNAGWNTNKLLDGPHEHCPVSNNMTSGARLVRSQISAELIPPQLDTEPESDVGASSSTDFGSLQKFALRAPKRSKPSFSAHFLSSFPSRILLVSFLWAALACTVLEVLKDGSAEEQTSKLAITSNVLSGASSGTLLLLGLFAGRAFTRYERGGTLWELRIRPSCHHLASSLLNFVHEGIVHPTDLRRMVGLVAAIPLLLKVELKGERDVREVAGLLSAQDMAEISSTNDMVLHCLDVIRAFVTRIMSHKTLLRAKEVSHPRERAVFVRTALSSLEEAVQEARLLRSFDMSPLFKILLATLLTVFMGIVPWISYDVSKWFTILWTPMIGYGMLTTYKIAVGIQRPFGGDVNDIDVDEISQLVVADVLQTYSSQKECLSIITNHPVPAREWCEKRKGEPTSEPWSTAAGAKSVRDSFSRSLSMAVFSIPVWQIIIIALWSSIVVVISFFIPRWLDFNRCENQFFCPFTIIDEDIKDYVGFAVFFLLGFRLNDAHARYVSAQALWQENILGTSHRIAQRFLHSFLAGSFHEGDVERFCGHLAGVSIALVNELRPNSNVLTRLNGILGEADVLRIRESKEPVSACLDVVRGYLFYSEILDDTTPERNGIGVEDYFHLLIYVDDLQTAAFKCRRIRRVQVPIGYCWHVRTFAWIWMVLLPIGLVETSGFLTVFWVVLVAFGLLGALHWSEKLSDPFSSDEAGIRLEEFMEQVVRAIEFELPRFERAAVTVVEEGRAFGRLESDKLGKEITSPFLDP